MFVGGDADRLIELAKTEKNPELRRTAIRNLGIMGSKKTGEALVQIYNTDKDPEIRRTVINGLFVQGNASALVDLARKESDPAMKKEIVSKLSVMGSKDPVVMQLHDGTAERKVEASHVDPVQADRVGSRHGHGARARPSPHSSRAFRTARSRPKRQARRSRSRSDRWSAPCRRRLDRLFRSGHRRRARHVLLSIPARRSSTARPRPCRAAAACVDSRTRSGTTMSTRPQAASPAGVIKLEGSDQDDRAVSGRESHRRTDPGVLGRLPARRRRPARALARERPACRQHRAPRVVSWRRRLTPRIESPMARSVPSRCTAIPPPTRRSNGSWP